MRQRSVQKFVGEFLEAKEGAKPLILTPQQYLLLLNSALDCLLRSEMGMLLLASIISY